MIKNSIIKEYRQIPVPGAILATEKTNFLCGKGMDIQDECRVVQISTIDNVDKYLNIKQEHIKSNKIDGSQTDQEKRGLTKWKFEIDTKSLLIDYLYDQIYTSNPWSPFKDLDDIESRGNRGQICLNYIKTNLVSRYKIKEVIFWASYFDLKLGQTPGSQQVQLLQNVATFSQIARPLLNPDSQKQTISIKEYNEGLIEIDYRQIQSSQQFTFLWYYDIIYVRA